MRVIDNLHWWWTLRKFRRERQRLEYLMFIGHDPRWRQVRRENNMLGIWGAAYTEEGDE